MIQTESRLKIADNSGAKVIGVISIREKGWQKFGKVGNIVSASVKDAVPHTALSKGEKVHAVIVRTKKEIKRKDGSYIRFDENAAVIIDLKTKAPIGTRIFGPVARELKTKGFSKIISLAPEVL